MPERHQPNTSSIDLSLSGLLAVQSLTLFVAIPLGTNHPAGHVLIDASHLLFALVCVLFLTRQRGVQVGLIFALTLLAMGPLIGGHLMPRLGLSGESWHDAVAFTALAFNAAVSTLVARHVFGPGRVTGHRVQGAVLLYLNVAAMFAIIYSALEAQWPGSIVLAGGGIIGREAGLRTATITYFSLTTITTTGYGDLVPIHPAIRSLANLESVFGHLFPATLLARVVALHVARGPRDGA
jgi:Ion channel